MAGLIIFAACAPAASPPVAVVVAEPAAPDASAAAAPPAADAGAEEVDAAEPPAEPLANVPQGVGVRKPPKLGTACVDVLADLKKRTNGGGPVDKPKRVDLDGDGSPDWIFTTDADAYAYRGHVYLARGRCGHWIGEWEGLPPEPRPTWANGVSDLESGTPCKRKCCASETKRLYRFDGVQLRKIAERTEPHGCGGPP